MQIVFLIAYLVVAVEIFAKSIVTDRKCHSTEMTCASLYLVVRSLLDVLSDEQREAVNNGLEGTMAKIIDEAEKERLRKR